MSGITDGGLESRAMAANSATSPVLCFIGGWGSTDAAWERTLACAGLSSEFAAPLFLSWLECIQNWPGALQKLRSLAGPCILVGWSLGGLLALRAALDLAPQKTAALVLVSATARMCGAVDAGGEYIGADPRAFAAMYARMARTPDVVLAEFAAACAAPDGDEEIRASWLRQTRQFTAEEMAFGLACLASFDLRERLGEIGVPCQILHGEGDYIVPLGSAQFLARRIASAELNVLSGRGHALPLTAPADVARCIATVIQEATKQVTSKVI